MLCVKDLDNYMNSSSCLNEINSFIRYINPITKRIYKSNKLDELACDVMRFEFLRKKEPCKNCIAMRTINKNRIQYGLIIKAKNSHIY